ncbi:MAG: tRNA glutamyl-Q(34) synthetase GluQRS [Pseudomonadales bacterium]
MNAAGVQGAGRFAPSPTGPLHAGSLLAAVASFLDARRQGIAWRLRLDDLDLPRNEAGADRAILLALECHALHWDGPVTRQSEHADRYAAALDELRRQELLFYCRCSRRALRHTTVYPGRCRGYVKPRADSAIRVRVDGAVVELDDLLLGPQRWPLATEGGDFVVRRRDGIVAYQLATAVDDGDADITRVIRGRDLLATTPRQVFLMSRLGLNVPVYGHVPLLVDRHGQKLSKQAHAPALDLTRPADNLARTLGLLGLPTAPTEAGCDEMLQWAVERFDLRGISGGDALAQ